MGERIIDPKFNIQEVYRTMNILNPYRFGGGTQSETAAYISRVTNDGGVIGSEAYINSVYSKLKELGILGNLVYWTDGRAGIKKDGNTYISKAYSLTDIVTDSAQASGVNQPLLIAGEKDFDGVNDFLQTNQVASLNLHSNYTMVSGFNYDATGQSSGIMDWGEQSNFKRRAMTFWTGGSGTKHYLYSSVFGSNIKGTTVLSPGVNYQGAVTVAANGAASIYMDGVLDGSGTHTLSAFVYNGTFIGKTGSNESLNGTLWNTAIFNIVLTQSQIAAIKDL